MKKIIAVLLILAVAASMYACTADYAAKYYGIWADDTQNVQLSLAEDGSAVLRVGATTYTYKWEAEDYDTVLLYIETPKVHFDTTGNTEATESADATDTTDTTDATGTTDVTDSTEATEATEATDVAVASEITESTEATEATESTEATDETGATDATEATEAVDPSTPSDTTTTGTEEEDDGKQVIAECTLSIKDGFMYLTIADPDDSKITCMLTKLK